MASGAKEGSRWVFWSSISKADVSCKYLTSTNQNRYSLSAYSTTTVIIIPQQFGISLIRVLNRHFDGLISASRNSLLKLWFNFAILLWWFIWLFSSPAYEAGDWTISGWRSAISQPFPFHHRKVIGAWQIGFTSYSIYQHFRMKNFIYLLSNCLVYLRIKCSEAFDK